MNSGCCDICSEYHVHNKKILKLNGTVPEKVTYLKICSPDDVQFDRITKLAKKSGYIEVFMCEEHYVFVILMNTEYQFKIENIK